MMDIEAKREREREKYQELLEKRPDYFSTNHGKDAFSIIGELFDELGDKRKIIDFGCGDNSFAKQCRDLGWDANGIDFVNPNADWRMPMHNTGLESDQFGVITAFDSLEHLLPEEVTEVLDEMARVASVDATFIFSICHRESNITALGENLHPTVRGRDWWETLISQHGDIDKERSTKKYIVGWFNK